MTAVVHTIGHSTHPIGEFIEILRGHGVAIVADVRTVPKSRNNPQFGQEALANSLAAADIGYRHFKGLGGLRKTSADSPNAGWRNKSFRGYADHMGTEEFAGALGELIDVAETGSTALMCAEAVPWRCHRSLIGDALLVRGFEVLDIFSATSARPHTLTSFARVSGTDITYPPELAESG
jgi:uncharacterized protein (DUF488 family)